jgi:hypothetical protein
MNTTESSQAELAELVDSSSSTSIPSPIDNNTHYTTTQQPYSKILRVTHTLTTIVLSIFMVIALTYGMLFILWTRYPISKCDNIPFTYLNSELAKSVKHFADDTFGKLSVNHLQFLGTHNSYHVTPAIPFSKTFIYTHDKIINQLHRGVRHFEFDSHFDRITNRWVVYHIAIVDSSTNCGDCLCDCLGEVKKWSDQNSNHTVMVIFLEPKTIFNAHPFCTGDDAYIFHRMESEVLSVFPLDQIIVPDQIRGNFTSLRSAVITRGWPSVESTRGKFMFVLNFWSENMHCKQYYENKTHPLFFMRTNGDDDNAAFVEMGSVGNNIAIKNNLKRNYFVRTGVSSSQESIKDCVDYGAQLLSTDIFDPYLPNITRCNPVLAPNCGLVNP